MENREPIRGALRGKVPRSKYLSLNEKKMCIIRTLLQHGKVSTGEFPVLAGIKPKKDYAYFAEALDELTRDDVIDSEPGEIQHVHAPTVYFIKKGQKAITFIWENFPDRHEILTTEDWAFEWIYQEKIRGIETEWIKEDVRTMLRASPTFLHLTMNATSLYDLALKYYEFNKLAWTSAIPPMKQQMMDALLGFQGIFAIHELFGVCVFMDLCTDPVKGQEGIEPLQQIKKRRYLDLLNMIAWYSDCRMLYYLKKLADVSEDEEQFSQIENLIQQGVNLAKKIRPPPIQDGQYAKTLSQLNTTISLLQKELGVEALLMKEVYDVDIVAKYFL